MKFEAKNDFDPVSLVRIIAHKRLVLDVCSNKRWVSKKKRRDLLSASSFKGHALINPPSCY